MKKVVGKKEVVIYMDNLKVHITPAVKEVMAELKFTYCMSPFYCPDYNPIEYYFSMLKRLVKRERLQDLVANRERDFDEIVKEVYDKMADYKIDNCILNVLKLYEIDFD